MTPARTRAFLGLLITLWSHSQQLSGSKPLPPRNVKLSSVEKGLKVTWDPPSELEGRPVDGYSIGYGKSMKTLRFLTVGKERRSELLEDVEPGVLHFLKMSAENKDGMSRPIYRAETPGGGEWVKLDGFAVDPLNRSSPSRMMSITSSQINPEPPPQKTSSGWQISPQSSSGPEAPYQTGGLSFRAQYKHRVDLSNHQADQRNNKKPKLASESVYMVSLQAPKPQARSAPISSPSKQIAPELEVLDEVEDITVRILSPQSVLITWLDPVVEKKKEISEGSRSYTVKYREKGESARWEFKDTSQRRLMLETLAADSMYEFSIRISQGNQQGKWSASVFQRTPESAPSGPPENFEVKPLRGKGTAVTAAWDPPEQTNGRVREYILSYAPALKPFGAKAVTYRGSSTSATIEGLTPGDRYTFKIRAVNRKGQGPQTKAIIVTMPASTHLRSTESHNPSQSSMEKSYMIESDNQNPDETEKSISQSATQSPPANRLRPLSQTRSYHSIFSSVRGSIRDGGSRKNSHSSSIPTKVNEDINTTESPAEEDTNLNEAVELTKPDEDKESLQTKDTKEVKPNNSDQVPKPSSDKRLPWIPQTSSIVDISRLRRPNSQRHGSRSRIRNQDTSNSFQKQESPDSRNNPTSTEGSHTRVTETVHVVKSQESKPEPVKEIESSSSLSSSPESSRSSYFSNSTTSLLPNLPLPSGTSTGTMLSNGRGVSRLQQGSPKTDSSSVSSQSRLPTRLSTDNQEIKNHDTNQANTLQGNQKEEQRTEVNEPISDITEQNENFDSHEEKGVDFTAVSSSRTKTSATTTSISIPNHSSRRVTGSRRKDGRIPWNRANSSVDAGRPIVKGLPSQVLNSQLDGDKNIISLTPAPIESTAMPISKNPHRVNIKSSHSHKADDATTEAPQITTTEHHKLQSLENESMNRKDSINMNPESLPQIPHRVPVLASNSRVRSPVVSRLKGSRFPSRLHPVQHRRPGAFRPNASSSSSVSSPVSSQNSPLVESTLTSDRNAAAESLNNVGSITGSSSHSSHGLSSGESSIEKTSPQSQNPVMGSRLRSASTTGNGNSHGKGKNGRSNLTAANGKESSASDENSKRNQVRYIIGPDGTKMIVDLNKGVLMNENGTVLRDSRGRSRKVALGADGKTIFDDQGSPLVHQEQLTSFEDGRRGWPVINPSDKYQTIGRKPINRTKLRTTTTIATTTAEPTTETLESTTLAADPTCPPGLFSRMDKNGLPMLDNDGILNCYSEDELFESTTVTFVTTSPPPTSQSLTPVIRLFNNTPSSEFDVTGKKRFTAPYVNYISKDPGAPCSLTEALEYLQVDVLADLMEKDQQTLNLNQPPKNKPHNVTVVAMEGCHSFVILDWARPLKDDMVSGYMVQSASYDDVLNNRWSTQPSSGTHLPVENLKPNSRYYFRVQAKNIFGLGPVSETLTYVTESDDPLLIARPPGGEPIWIPFSFRYNQAHSSCKGSQFVKRTWYRKFVGVVLCNSLRYKIFMADGLRGTFHSIADTFGHGEDHCQFVDSHLDGRTGPHSLSFNLPTAQGYYRSYRQEPVNFGAIGRRTPHPFIGWYECGVPIPGKW